MARVWRRDGVKKAWIQAGASACAASAVFVWMFAPFAIACKLGMATLLVWEIPTVGATFALALWSRWMKHAKQTYAPAAVPSGPDLVEPPLQSVLPGLEEQSAGNEDGPWPSCSLEQREHG